MFRPPALAWLSALAFTLGSAALNANAAPINGGHGGGAGHAGVYHGGYGYGGYRGYGGWGGYGWGGYGWGWPWWGLGVGVGFGYGYYGYGYPYYGYPYPAYSADPAYAGGPPVGPTLAAARGLPGTTPAGSPLVIPNGEVTLNVHIPSDAIVSINGNKTSQTGSHARVRLFGPLAGTNLFVHHPCAVDRPLRETGRQQPHVDRDGRRAAHGRFRRTATAPGRNLPTAINL